MNVLPVILRELRAQARQPFTFWLRMLGVVVLLSAGCFFYLEESFRHPNFGGALFGLMHLTLLCSVWILVPLGAADCLSRERREGTLGLLFLTPLKARDIVIAKGLTHGLRGMTLLVAVLPVLTIPFLIGGISWQQATAAAIVNFTAICWALAAALLASAIARNGLRAMGLAALLAAVALLIQSYLAGALLAANVGRNLRGGYSSLDFNLLMGFAANGLHPAAWNIWTVGIPGVKPPQLMAASIQSAVVSLLVLILAVLVAAWRVRRSWQEEPPSVRVQQIERVFFQPVIWVSFLHRWMRWKLERNPLGWLEQRSWSGRLVTWTWFAIIVSVQSTALTDQGFFRSYRTWENLMAWLLTLSLAASAAGSFRRERESGVLELLLVSPLTTAQIIGGRLRGLWGQFLPSIVLLFGIWIYFAEILPDRGGDFAQIWFFLVTYGVLPIIGLYYSVSCRHFITAFLFTLGMTVALPLLVFGVARMVWWSYAGGLGFGGVAGMSDSSSIAWLLQLVSARIFYRLLCRRLERRSFPLERGTP